MKKPTQHQSIFDIAKKGQARRSPVIKPKQSTATTQAANRPTALTPVLTPKQLLEQVQRMQNELRQLMEQLNHLARVTGISLTQAIQIPEYLSPEDQRFLLAHMQKQEENLEKLVVIPQPQLEKQKKKKARQENERTKRTVGKRKRWLSL